TAHAATSSASTLPLRSRMRPRGDSVWTVRVLNAIASARRLCSGPIWRNHRRARRETNKATMTTPTMVTRTRLFSVMKNERRVARCLCERYRTIPGLRESPEPPRRLHSIGMTDCQRDQQEHERRDCCVVERGNRDHLNSMHSLDTVDTRKDPDADQEQAT